MSQVAADAWLIFAAGNLLAGVGIVVRVIWYLATGN